ncbi:hypothetical protein ACRAWD_22195 [Caulobacter segnis]
MLVIVDQEKLADPLGILGRAPKSACSMKALSARASATPRQLHRP